MSRPDDQIPGISYRFKDQTLLSEALTHRSSSSRNYERLEFLGDAVLGFAIASRLFALRPDVDEGSLSRLRSRVVRGESLARVAKTLSLGDHLIMGEGELKSGGYLRDSILADALEAVLGAIYLDGGILACETVIGELFDPVLHALPDAESLKDPKTRLQEWLQARARALPVYELIAEEGADHAKQFTVECRLEDENLSRSATGRSRRRAEQRAAAAILEKLADEHK